MVEVSNNFIQECEANVGTYKFGKIKVNYIDDNPFNYEQGAYSSSNGTKIDAEQSIRYNKLVECKPNFKYKIELGNSAYKMKIVTYNANQAFIAAHDNLAEGSELTTESTAAYISVTIYSNDTLEGTSITLNNTIRNSEISGAELKGNTTQNGTPTPSSPVPINNVTGEQVVTICGKNLFDKDKEAEKYFYNARGVKELSNDTTFINQEYDNIDFSSITISFSGKNGTPCVRVCEYNSNGTFIKRTLLQNNNQLLNFDSNTKKVIFSTNAEGFTNLQTEKGTSATTYEPYQGKDYEINLGANILDLQNSWVSSKNSTQNGLHYILNGDDTISISGTSTGYSGTYARSYNSTDVFMTLKANHTYRVLVEVSDKTSNINSRVYFGTTSANIGGFSLTSIGGNGTYYKDYTPTQDIGLTQYSVIGAESAGETSLTMKIAIYDITTNVINKYTKYFTPIELNKIGNYQDFIKKGTGKNLFDKNNANILNGWLDNNKMALNPTQLNRLFYIPCKANTTYTISRSILTSTFRVATYDSEPFPTIGSSEAQYDVSGLIKDNSATSITIITGANAKYLIVHYGRLETDLDIEESLKTIQIEENSQATSYEPYGYKDKWYIEKNIGKVVLDGSRNWTKSGNTNIDRFVLSGYVNYGDTNCFSNYFDNGIYSDTNYTKNQIFLNTYSSTKRIIINYSTVGTTTLAQFKTWLQSNNTIVYYVLANPTYTLIENEELIEQLDALSHAETQEGTTNIASSGILPAILDITPNLIESIRGKQTTPIVGYNITGDDDLINFKITSKADSNGNILGATSQSQVDIEIFNENNTHNLENKQVYISTGLNETEGNYCKWQPFTITQTKDTQTKNHTTYTGYDDMMRGNEAYIDNVDYGEEGVTLYDFTCKLAKEMGMALGNTTMTNGDFIVKGNNFTNNEAKLVVLKNVAQMAGGFAMIDRDNLLRIVELSPEDAMTPIELTTNLYTEDFQNSAKFGEINEFAIGETNIETNAIVRSDDASIAKNGVKKIEILDNMFLGLLEDKEIAIEPLWDAFNGFGYYPFKTPYNGYPYIDLGDKVNITDINSNVYGTLVLNNVFEYNGGYKGNIGAEALSITAARYKTNNTLSKQFRKVGIDIDRVEGKITSEIAAATDGITNAYNTAISQTEKNINLSVTEINKVLSGNPAVEGDTGLEGTVSKINQTYLTVDSDDFTVVSSTATEAKKKADAVEENTKKIVSQLHFDAETGLTISAEGSTDDDMKLNLTNSQVNFMYRNSPVLVINGNKIEFTGATFQKFDLGNYVWQAEDDDSLSLIYEGD